LEQLPYYSKALLNEGHLFLSGFYEGTDLEMLQSKAEECGLTYLNHLTKDRWVAAHFFKP